MPYVGQNLRDAADPFIESLADLIRSLPERRRKGYANYIITRIAASGMKPVPWSYDSLSNAHAALADAAGEFKRRMIDPYEDEAKDRNGDIPEYRGH